jgi:hypothetical protein
MAWWVRRAAVRRGRAAEGRASSSPPLDRKPRSSHDSRPKPPKLARPRGFFLSRRYKFCLDVNDTKEGKWHSWPSSMVRVYVKVLILLYLWHHSAKGANFSPWHSSILLAGFTEPRLAIPPQRLNPIQRRAQSVVVHATEAPGGPAMAASASTANTSDAASTARKLALKHSPVGGGSVGEPQTSASCGSPATSSTSRGQRAFRSNARCDRSHSKGADDKIATSS